MKTKKIYLVILFCLPFNSYAGALKNTDIITDQTSIVTQRERAQAGQLKSSGGWEVKQTAYNTKTGNIEVVAQKGDKYAHVAVSTVSDKSFLQRVGGFLFKAAKKFSGGWFSWVPDLISTFGSEPDSVYIDEDGNFKFDKKGKLKASYFSYRGNYFDTADQAADFGCRDRAAKMTGSKSEMTYRGHITYSTFTYWVSNSNIKYFSHRAYCHTVRSSGDLQYADEFFVIEYFLPDNPTTADIASVFRQGMSANKPNRDLFRRVAEYDVSNGLYDAKFEEVAKVPDNPTSPEFVPGTAPVVSSPSVVAPEPLPSPNPGTNPNPGTSPSPNPGTNPNPGTSPSPNPAPNPSPNPDRSNQQEPEGFSLPSFCSWASFLCFRANEDKKAPEELENFDYNVEEKQLTKNPVDFDVEYLAYGGACPAPIRFDLNVGLVAVPLEYSLTPLCDFAKTVRPAILALAYLTALGIVVSAIRS